MFVHSVFFWLKPGLTADQVRAFRGGLETLRGVASARAVYIGEAAATSRPVVDRSYTFGLTVLLEDLAGHDAYQADPIHLAFVREYAKDWERVVIYDTRE
ncbi:MAG: Dabb family protein [Candidatus Hydrogenedentes bacterium]|nr:Dabb family protein [Candidatus Hydrogenedentota bacterium]